MGETADTPDTPTHDTKEPDRRCPLRKLLAWLKPKKRITNSGTPGKGAEGGVS